jgi:dTDP-4-amino-4,6-dideoxygalactose transaminase
MIPISKPSFLEDAEQDVLAVLRSGQLAHGSRVQEFERAFAGYLGVKHASALNSGTSALFAALVAHGIGPGDEVITTSFTFIATLNAILYAGAAPRLVDVDESFNIDPRRIESAITGRTKAIMPVHLYGQTAAMDEIMQVAHRHQLVVIEDACQAHGAKYDGKFAGTFGTGCFSFYATKNMTTGEGGMLTTDDDKIASQVRLLINHGMKERYHHQQMGYNLRLTEIAGAIGIRQLERLDEMNKLRLENAEYFDKQLAGIPGLILPKSYPNRMHVYHQFTLRLTPEFRMARADFISQLRARGIGSSIYYPQPAHHAPYLRLADWGQVELPCTEMLTRQVVSIPVHPGVAAGDRERIVSAIRAIGTGEPGA